LPEAVPVKFDGKGVAQLSNWRVKIDKGEPKPKVIAASHDGRATLHIQSDTNGCVASWRSRIFLEAGKYRFVALARTAGVVPLKGGAGAGAGVRISKGKRTHQLFGYSDWTPLDFDFDVPTASDVDLVCELRAERGDVWFDRDSLRLIKVK
jgi:hypothetical protein